jgi:hypothetical protein
MVPVNPMSRRAVLQTLVAGAAAAAAAVTPALSLPASAAQLIAERAADPLTRADRAFLTQGLQHGAWVLPGPGAWVPTPQRFIESGFTAPTFAKKPGWSEELMAGLPSHYRWSVAEDPHRNGGPLGPPPAAGTPILQGPRAANAGRLFSICVGDEENLDSQHIEWWAEYFSRLRQEAPQAVLHNNQAPGQGSDQQMREYIQTCHPDLLTFDCYYFDRNPQYPGGSVKGLYDMTARYRGLALQGQDGKGTNPLAFGQYTCGFPLPLSPSSHPNERKYITSESQLKIVGNVTWAMGGRWLNLFRWVHEWADPGYETDGLFLNYADGSPTPQFYQFQEVNQTLRAFNPWLVRLRTENIAIRRGKTSDGADIPASTVADFTPELSRHSWVSDITAVNTGTANNGRPGDVVFGSFRTQPGLTSEEIGWYLPGPDARAFMIVNGLTASNSDPTKHDGTGGRGVDTKQRITVRLNTGNAGNYVLKRVDRRDGSLVAVPLTRVAGGEHEFGIEVPGGEAHLFIWA